MRWTVVGLILVVACGTPPVEDETDPPEPIPLDAGEIETPDAVFDGGQEIDAGEIDAGELDAGEPDAGEPDAGEPDAGEPDAGEPDAGEPDAGTVGRIVYPVGRTHSPLTPEVASHLQQVASRKLTREADVFSKIGDSNTVSSGYLHCFAGPNVNLAGRSELDPAWAHFRGGQVGTTTPFNRTSLSATVGWRAVHPIAGNPTPLAKELAAANPRYATVMFGTNDVGFADPYTYGRSLFTIVDKLLAEGVVPIVSAVPRRDDSANADAWVPRFNLVARGIAQSRRVPFVDLHRELENVPRHGLGSDGVHFNSYNPGSGSRACDFTQAGLQYGHNVRNLLMLQALDRAWSSVEGRVPPDVTAPRRLGTGLPGDEIVIDTLPFVDVRDTRSEGLARIDRYDGCSQADESGPEILYRLELSRPTNLRAFVVALGSSDIDIHLLSSPDAGAACMARNDKVITQTLAAGTWWLALDTYRGATSGLLPGEYLLAVLAE